MFAVFELAEDIKINEGCEVGEGGVDSHSRAMSPLGDVDTQTCC